MCRLRVLAAMSVVAFLAGCGGKSAAKKYETPEAVFAAFQKATEAGDWQVAAHCLTSDDQSMMADGLIIGASFSTMGDANKEKDLTALLKKHGVDLDQKNEPPAPGPGGQTPSPSDKIKDKPALIADLMTWLKKNADGGGGPDLGLKKLDQLKIVGDRATGTVETARGNRPIEFHRVDGGWLISMEGGRPRGGGGLDAGPGQSGFDGPADFPSEKVSDSSPAADPKAGHGTLTIKDKAHSLKYAIAYKTKRFDDPCTAVLLTTKPLGDGKLAELQTMLEREGKDLGFFVFDVSLKLMFDDAGKPVYLYAWADNVNINDNSGIEAQVSERDGRIVGSAKRIGDDKADDEFAYKFDVDFDVALLPTKGKAAEPNKLQETERAVESPNEIDTDNPVKEKEKATETTTEPAPPVNETPREPAVTVDETPREPATVAEAIRLLDLRTFPVMAGAEAPDEHRQVGLLLYQRNGELAEAFEFQRKHLKELGWKELPGGQSVESGNPRAIFTQDGFIVSMSAALFVSIQNHGNVILGKLPVPSGAEPHYGDLTQASYVTTAAADETRKICEVSLLKLGWKPYGHAGDTKYFKQNAVLLSARVSTHEAQPGKTFIDYSTEMLSTDLPVPADVEDPRYTDALKRLSFDQPGNAVEKLAAFYNEELAKQGFQATSKPIGDKEVAVVYRNDAKDMITLDMKLYNELTRVSVRQYSGEEVAELDRRHQEEVAKREAERQLRVEAEKRETQRQRAAEAARREAEAAKKLAQKVTVPIPGKAKKVEQDDEDSVEITVALGAGKPILEALRKHFEAAGWSADKVELEDDDGLLRLSKGDQSLEFDYTEWITNGEIDVDGRNVVLELNRDLAEFASLGGLPAPKAPPAELLAKAPADIPIPADARELKVRTGANVAFEVAGDVKQAAAYFRTAMTRHGWTYDASFSHFDEKFASLSFKKGQKPCGISLTNIFGGDLTSVTIAGGGMDWKKLKGARATADPAVLAAAGAKLDAGSPKQPAPDARKKPAPAPAKAQPKPVTKRTK